MVIIMPMRKLLRYFASRKMTECMDPQQTGFLERRMFADHVQRYEFASNITRNKSITRNKRVLDIACGEGYGTHILSKNTGNVTAVDMSKELEKRKYNKKKIKFVCSDAIVFLRKNKKKFDVIVSFETVEHLKEYEKFIHLLHKNLKRGGLLVISTPNKFFTDAFYGGNFNPYHVKEFYTEELYNIIFKIFKNKPDIFVQRPANKNHAVLSTIYSFIVNEKPDIKKDNGSIVGVDNIYVVRK